MRSLSIFVLGILLLLIASALGQQTAGECLDKGIALFDQGKYDEALKSYDRAIEVNPQNAGAWYNKSFALNRLGRTTEAIAAFTKARELGTRIRDLLHLLSNLS